ncbi:MAG TPA: peptidase E [Mycobacteriales bacterium]|nr:peptidase E [Mycobacteriales bacterium]
MPAEPTILATSGGFTSSGRGPIGWRRGPLIDYALSLSGTERPRICYLATAQGDSPLSIAAFYNAFAACTDALPSHLALYPMPSAEDPAAHLLVQDVIWVGGGSVANLLALWRVHGLDAVFREAWEKGIVLAGVSAGSICWHMGGTTDSFGPELRLIDNGLGLLPYANGVHYDVEPQRRPLLQSLVASGALPTAHATDDGVGLLYRGTELVEVVSELPDAAAYKVEADGAGGATETVMVPRLLTA